MNISRRVFVGSMAAASTVARLFAATQAQAPKIGVTDWNLKKTGDLDAVPLAKSLGFDGVQVSLGRKPVDGRLALENAEIQAQYIARAKQQNIALAGTCLDILTRHYFKSDKLAQECGARGIPTDHSLKSC